MSRFTRRDATGIWVKEPDDYATYYPYYDGSYEAIEKLAHYEDLEEAGRLIVAIRCKDCEHFTPDNDNEHLGYCKYWDNYNSKLGYCSGAKLAELKGE